MTQPSVQPSNQRPSVNASGPFFGFLLALALLFGIVTAYAVRLNPLNHNDQATYGISRYVFLDECKKEMENISALPTTVLMQGQPVASDNLSKLIQDAKLLHTGETLGVNTTASSRDMLRQVQPIPEAEGQPKVVGLQWQTPVEIHARSGTSDRVISPAVMQCQYDKAKGKPEASLYISQ